MMKRFSVAVTRRVEFEVDDTLVPDDEWRTQFYKSIHDLADVARHLGYNLLVNNIDRLDRLDGWADRPNALWKVDWTTHVSELESVDAL